MVKKIVWPYVALLFAVNTFAQEQRLAITKADDFFRRAEFIQAAQVYEMLEAEKKDNKAIRQKLAACYRATNQYGLAADLYRQLVVEDPSRPDNLFYYADMLKNQGKFEEAKIAYRQYLYRQKGGDERTVAIRIAGCDSAQLWMKHPSPHQVSNLQVLNTASSDWGAQAFGKDSILFVSGYPHATAAKNHKPSPGKGDKENSGYQKVYVLDSTAGKYFGFTQAFSPSGSEFSFHIGPVAFSAGYDTAFITVTYAGKIKADRHAREDFDTRRLALYTTVKVNGKWQPPQPFIYNNVDEYSLGHAALSKDGNTLYFVSDKKGGQGKTDIWYCEKKGEAWSTPVNCGNKINTPEEDEFPTIADQNGTLFFSSKGYAGIGGFDLFSTQGSKDQWSQPVNLHYPLNSPGDDFYYTSRDAATGFLSSNRPGGKGDDDIYRFLLNQPSDQVMRRIIIVEETTVLDKNDGKPIEGAAVELYNSKRKARWRQHTAANGKTYNLLEKNQPYHLVAEKEKYDSATHDFQTDSQPHADTMRITLLLSRGDTWKTGVSFILQNLYYDLDKWNIRPDAAKVLDSLAVLLRQHPDAKIELSSHTDSRASSAYNYLLSERRAKAAVAYLISKQEVDPAQLEARWYGETRPVNRCVDGVKCTEPEYQKNRRTEVKVLK